MRALGSATTFWWVARQGWGRPSSRRVQPRVAATRVQGWGRLIPEHEEQSPASEPVHQDS